MLRVDTDSGNTLVDGSFTVQGHTSLQVPCRHEWNDVIPLYHLSSCSPLLPSLRAYHFTLSQRAVSNAEAVC